VRIALMRLDPNLINDANVSYISKHLKMTEPAGINADAARALGALGTTAKAKIPDLMECLKSSDTSLVAWSAWALGQMGPDAKQAIPLLQTLQESADPAVKNAATEAIKTINNPPRRP
jgi:HEAT repeat protein